MRKGEKDLVENNNILNNFKGCSGQRQERSVILKRLQLRQMKKVLVA